MCGYWNLATIAGIKYNGLTTEQQIRQSFKNAIKEDYNCYLLGNSRIYRDINPDKLTGVKAYNFGHDNDSYNQMYYKLEYLLAHDKKIETLIIGTDYFQFSFLADTRNYIYCKLFPSEYSQDFENNYTEGFVSSLVTQWSAKKMLWKDCIKYVMDITPPPNTIRYQKNNGQCIVFGTATPDDTVERDSSVLEIQYEYFEKIVDVCTKNDIELYVIMPPTRDAELENYTEEELKAFDIMINNTLGERYQQNYYNCSRLNGLTDYNNFIDITHLNSDAADRFSEYINQKILQETQ